MSRATPMQRWAAKVQLPADPNGCWEWLGSKARGGYGAIYVDGRQRPAHRYGYERFVSAVPVELHIDHLCRNPSCVNPSHLEAVTPRENTLRGVGPSAVNAAKRYCDKGHSLDGEGAYRRKDRRGRHCRLCAREDQKAYVSKPEANKRHRERCKRSNAHTATSGRRDAYNANRRATRTARRDELNEIRRERRRQSAPPCPVCSRRYQDLPRHLLTLHPEFANAQ